MVIATGEYYITLKFSLRDQNFTLHLTGVYGPYTRHEKKDLLRELAVIRGICPGPWVTCGDFNTTRFASERRTSSSFTADMADFANCIEELKLIDPPLTGGSFTWI